MRFVIGEIDVMCKRAELMSFGKDENVEIRHAAMDLHIAALKLGIALRAEELANLKEEKCQGTNTTVTDASS